MASAIFQIRDNTLVNPWTLVGGAVAYGNPDKLAVDVNATESNRNQCRIGASGTIFKWAFGIIDGTTVADKTLTLRINGVDVPGSAIVSAHGVTADYQVSNLGFAVVETDKLTVKTDMTGVSGSATVGGVLVYFTSSEYPGEEFVRIGDSHSTAQSVGAGLTRYGVLDNLSSAVNSTESNVQRYYGINGAARKLFINVASNAATTNSTITLRQGGSDIATITVGSGATGYFDTDVNVTIADNDLLNIKVICGSTGAITFDCWGMIATVSGTT